MADPHDAYLTRICPELDEFRFYSLQVIAGLFGNWGLQREWGRLGRRGTVRKTWYDTEAEARENLHAWVQKKQRRGYQLVSG